MRLDPRRRTVAALSAGSPSLGEGALRAGPNSNRQWHGVHYEGDGPGGTGQSEAGLITPGKPMENGCDESFNRSTESSVRMPGRAPVPDCGGYARDYRRMEA